MTKEQLSWVVLLQAPWGHVHWRLARASPFRCPLMALGGRPQHVTTSASPWGWSSPARVTEKAVTFSVMGHSDGDPRPSPPGPPWRPGSWSRWSFVTQATLKTAVSSLLPLAAQSSAVGDSGQVSPGR